MDACTIRTLAALAALIAYGLLSGGVRADTLGAIARCESGGEQFRPDGRVVRNHGWLGKFQINKRLHFKRAERLGMDLYTLSGNTAYAEYLLRYFGTAPWKASRRCWRRK